MFHLKYRLPFALAIAALMVVTVTIWTSTTEDGKGGNEQAARWGGATDLRRALTTSFSPPLWTGAVDHGAVGATPSIDDTEEEGDEEGKKERAVGDDDLVAPFLREVAFTGEDEDDAAVDEFGVDESRELQSTCMGQCKGDYQCDSNQPCFKCMYFDRNMDGVCCEPGGGGCAGGGNRFNVGCGVQCSLDTDCNISPCLSCFGGFCREGVVNICEGPCGGQRCSVGCLCNRANPPWCMQIGGQCGDSCLNDNGCRNGNCPFCRNVGGQMQCVNNGGGSNNMLGRCNDRCFNQNDCLRNTNNNCIVCDFTLGIAGEGRCAVNRVVNPAILRGCGERCVRDRECGLNGCNFCVGGFCDGNRFPNTNNFRCSGTCIDSSMCPAGCSCIARLCQ